MSQERNVNVRTWCSKRNVRMTSIVGRRKLLVTIDSEMHKKEMRSCVRCRSRNRSFWRRDGNGSIRTTAIRASNLESDDPDPGKTRRTSIWRQEWIGSIMKWSPTIVLMFGFVCNVSGIGLIDDTEPLFAEAARQMRRTGDWITPQFNGQERFDKPPLVYWMVAIALRGTGENVWFLRLPSLLLSVY